MQEKVPAKIQEETKKDEIYVSVKKKKSTIEYEKDLKNLQIELLKFQNYVKAKGLKVLILIEGRDAAGKGGAIKRLIEYLAQKLKEDRLEKEKKLVSDSKEVEVLL